MLIGKAKDLKKDFDNYEKFQREMIHTLEYWDRENLILTKVISNFNIDKLFL